MTLPWRITCTCFSRHALLIRDPVHRANVVNVYINYFRRPLDSGYDRALIRTIRGVGYQIGGNGQHTEVGQD